APGSRIGTCSLRRKVQLELIRPDINTSDIRGNVDTRLKKMDSGMYDGIILACAGLSRLNLNNRISEVLDWYYAPGPGALAAEIRIDNFAIKSIIESVTEKAVMQQVIAERAFIHRLNGGCHIPIGVKCSVNDAMLKLDGWLSSQDGSRIISDCISGKLDEASSIGTLLAEKLIAQGAGDIL
ncbi:MAG: hydroxymethylbilane synthase, partial [Fibrobacteres bacterium]|nr:hydroxymethylbilane synthase [Fibrobacterota bacterium]